MDPGLRRNDNRNEGNKKGEQQKPEVSSVPQAKEGGQRTAAASDQTKPEPTSSAPPVEEQLSGAEATKPHADDVGKDPGHSPVDRETAAKATALQERLGTPDPNTPLVLPGAIKEDQTGAQKTSAADVPQEWAALQDKFAITEDHLNKLKPPEETLATAAPEDSTGPRSVQQANSFKV